MWVNLHHHFLRSGRFFYGVDETRVRVILHSNLLVQCLVAFFFFSENGSRWLLLILKTTQFFLGTNTAYSNTLLYLGTHLNLKM